MNDGLKSLKRVAILLGAILSLGACAEARLSAVPPEETHRASILGIPNARIFADDPAGFVEEYQHRIEREEKYYASIGRPLPPDNYLALSGGADDAAFGAGLLVGLSEGAHRPSFSGVIGISAGALIAPFAFLGSEYDPVLTDIFTHLDQRQVYNERPLVIALTSDALAETTPLKSLIDKYLDKTVVERIATEYEHGRVLVVVTTDLDAGLPVAWNIGAIADSGNPQAISMIRNVLLASAAIPAVYPPVMFDVTVNGVKHQELHVDGGAMQQIFLYPPTFNVGRLPTSPSSPPHAAYIIRNGRITVEWNEVKRATLAIAERAVDTLTTSSADGDLYRIYATTKRDGVGYNLAFIRDDFTVPHPAAQFDHDYMTKLFEYARTRARADNVWQSAPPGL